MKRLITILIICKLGIFLPTLGQTLSVFDINFENFPRISAKFYAFDNNGNRILGLSPEDFEILENGIKRKVTRVSCPGLKPVQNISSVLVMDISGSMGLGSGGVTNLDLAKLAARTWIKGLPEGGSECAITAFDHLNYLIQDFTNEKSKLLSAIEKLEPRGGTDYDMALIDPLAGGLLISSKGKYKKVIILLTDGMPNREPHTQDIIAEAIYQKARIYGITLGMPCPQNIKDMTTETGGECFENVRTEEEIQKIYLKILEIEKGGEPCTIEWESEKMCEEHQVLVEINLKKHTLKTQINYTPSALALKKLMFNPNYIVFKSKETNKTHDTIITITAFNGNFNVKSININNPFYDVSPKSFILNDGDTVSLKIYFTPTDSIFSFEDIKFITDECIFHYSVFANYPKYKLKPNNLELTHPNGGEIFVAGSDTVITWKGIPKESFVKLEYSIDSGKTWRFIDTAKGGNYKWSKIPKPSTKNALIKIKHLNKESFNDTLIMKWGTLSYGSVAWHPIGNLIAINLPGGKTGLFNYETKTFDTIIQGNHYGEQTFFNNGIITITGSWGQNELNVWDIVTFTKIFSQKINYKVSNLVVNQAGDLIAFIDEITKKIVLINPYSGNTLRTIPINQSFIYDMAFDEKSENLVLACGGSILVFDLNTGNLIKTIKLNKWEFCYQLNLDASVLAIKGYISNSFNSFLKLVDFRNLNTIDSFKLDENLYNLFPTVSFNRINKNIIAVGLKEKIIIRNLALPLSSQRTIITKSFGSYVSSMSFKPTNDAILAINSDLSVIFWDFNSDKQLFTLSPIGNKVYSISLSPLNTLIATGDTNGTVMLWKLENGTVIGKRKIHSDIIYALTFSPDGSKIATGGRDDKVTILNSPTLSVFAEILGGNASFSDIYSLCFTRDEKYLIGGTRGGKIIVFNLSKLDDFIIIPYAHNDLVTTIQVSPDNSFFASGSADGTIKFWSIGKDWKNIATLTGHTDKVESISFSSDGKYLASGSFDKTIKIWDVKEKKLLSTIQGHKDKIKFVSFSPIAYQVASCGYENYIYIWDVIKSKLLNKIYAHDETIYAVNYSNDGRFLVSGSFDGTIKLWEVSDEEVQFDISDSVFSIVNPFPLSHDIDLGDCEIFNSKDTIIVDFIKNVGSWKFQVDSIFFRGPDSKAFYIKSGFPKYIVEPGSSHYIEIGFKPTMIKTYKAEIVILTQSDTLVHTISGNGVNEKVKIIGNIIDFGKVDLGWYVDKVDVVTIHNPGSVSVTITDTKLGFPYSKDFTILSGGGSFTLQPGEVRKMDLRFKPSDEGRTSGTLEFHYNGVGSPAVVRLFGEGVRKSPRILSNFTGFQELICENETLGQIEIKNQGGNDLIVKQLDIKGQNYEDFFVVNQTPIVIPPDSIYYLQVIFRPKSFGFKTAELLIHSNAYPDSILTIILNAKKDLVDFTLPADTINLGLLCPNESFDTTFAITNTGTLPLMLNVLTSANLNSFTQNIFIPENQHNQLTFNFKGLPNEGRFIEQITIFDTICGIRKNIFVIGEIQLPRISSDSLYIQAVIGTKSNSNITIKNIGPRPIEIKSISNVVGPFEINLPTFPIKLDVGEKVDLPIVYSPTENWNDTLNLIINFDPCQQSHSTKIIGSPVLASATIKTINLEGYPGDIVAIPIILEEDINLEQAQVNSIDVDLFFNPTLLYPKYHEIQILDEKTAKITIQALPTKLGLDKTLTNLEFFVGLGNADECDLILKNAKPNGGLAQINLINGKFRLLGVCREGGTRLLNPYNTATIKNVLPNPANEYVEIELSLSEIGNHKLVLFNSFGEIVKSIKFYNNTINNYHKFQMNVKDFSPGLYFIFYQSPTFTAIKALSVVK